MDPYKSPQLEPADEHRAEIEELIQAEPAQVEQLGQLHYLLFAAGFFLAWSMTPELREAFELNQYSLSLLRFVGRALLNAAPLAAIALAAWRRHERATSFPTQFGHWLLLIQGTIFVSQFLVTTDYWRETFRNDDADLLAIHSRFFVATFGFQWFAAVSIWSIAWYYSRGATYWRIYAAAMVLQLLWQMMFYFFNPAPHILQPVLMINLLLAAAVMLSFLVAAVRDLLWSQRGKDPLHWIGVALQFALIALPRLELMLLRGF